MANAFSNAFQNLTGHKPLSWQTRLFSELVEKNHWPEVIDIPTGLGKTMIIAIWLIARAMGMKVPTRLIYVVDRRTVIDQATDLVKKLCENSQAALGIEPPAISTLRGQLADNREWLRDPSKPAIIIGTVDLIGSALLFSGYRSSYKRRPLEAGMLGQDSLLVLDEAHLSKPFEELLVGPKRTSGERDGGICKYQCGHGNPMQVIRMSATTNESDETSIFRLDTDPNSKTFDLWSKLDENGEETNPIKTRFEATKTLRIEPLPDKQKLTDKLADEAIKLAENNSLRGKRIVVFARKPEDAKAIAKAIRKHVIESVDAASPKPKKVKTIPYTDAVEVLTGTMRGLERDELVEKPVLKRFLNGDETPGEIHDPIFLIATSAGEVGFDLNADHMVCDATTIDSLIQRLGRVNRRGKSPATIVLVSEIAKKAKDGTPVELKGVDLATANTLKLLEEVADGNVSPKNIAAMKTSKWKDGYADACSPAPTTVELTDILLDNWSMTSITEPMPGRPTVGPWLRGITDELPQTTIAWRTELDFEGFVNLDIEDIEEWFDTHRILTHETLAVPTSSKTEGSAEKWLIARWDELGKTLGEEEQRRIGERLVIIDQSGLKAIPLKNLIGELRRGNATSIRYANLILPASFGGIERRVGLLDAGAPAKPADEQNADEQTQETNVRARLIVPDVADVRDRYRETTEQSEDGGAESTPLDPRAQKPTKYARYTLELELDDDKSTRLVSYVPRQERLDWGVTKQYLHNHNGERGHTECVHSYACLILKHLGLQPDNPIWQAVSLAAKWHDGGKARERWQRCAGRKPDEPPLAKTDGKMRRDPRGYRHEFGSLREFTDAFKAGGLLNDAGEPISQEVFDLAMHLIATHHGRGRPHFPKGGFDPDCEPRTDEIHTDVIRRYARLQRKYGWWYLAWLENLLRCADALASADQDAEDDFADTEGGDK